MGSPITTLLQSLKNTQNILRKGSKYVLTLLMHPPSSHMCSLFLPEGFGKSYWRKNKKKQRSNVGLCIMRSTMFHACSGMCVDLQHQSYRKAQGRRVGRGTGTAPIHLWSLERHYWSQGCKDPHRQRYVINRPFATLPNSCVAWQGLRRPVLSWMHDKRAQRIQREMRDMILTRAGEIAKIVQLNQRQTEWGDFYPLKADICWLPDVRTIITEGSAEEFEALKAGLPDRLPFLTMEFKEARSAALVALLPYKNPSVEKLSLATTWFQCENCWCPALRYSSALVHNCFKWHYSNSPESDQYYMELVGQPWALSKDMSFHKEKAELGRKIILAAGGDPETLTYQEMIDQGYTVWFVY
jgi:hypothetical protein